MFNKNCQNDKIKNVQNKFSSLEKFKTPYYESVKILFFYLIFGSLCFFISDKFVSIFFPSKDSSSYLLIYSGFFLFFTSIFYFFIILKRIFYYKKEIDKVMLNYENLYTSYKGLLCIKEKFDETYLNLVKNEDKLKLSNERFKLIIEGANDGFWEWDLLNNKYYTSIFHNEKFGYGKEDSKNTLDEWKSIFHKDDKERAYNQVMEYLQEKNDETYVSSYRVKTKRGQYRWILSRGKGIWDDNGNPIKIVGSHTDITDDVYMQELFLRDKEISDKLINKAPILIVIRDKDGKIIRFNPYAEKVTGWKECDVLGMEKFDFIIPLESRKLLNKDYENLINNNDGTKNREIEILSKTGEGSTILWNSSLIEGNDGLIIGSVSIGIDITEKRKMIKTLHNLAYYDPLTNLPNKSLLSDIVNNKIKQIENSDEKLSLVYIDIDNLKHINDTLGHNMGDEIIKTIAHLINREVKPPHVAGRISGDEFAILYKDVKDSNSVLNEISRIIKLLRQPIIMDNNEFYISVSSGIAIYPDHGNNFSQLIQSADIAMFSQKESGKDGVCIFDESMGHRTWQILKMGNQLKSAINNKEFALFFQPQYDIQLGKLTGAEALIRWIHPDKGFVSPIEFIPFAEECGIIDKIDNWVIERACKELRKIFDLGFNDLKVSVNISGKMLSSKNLVNTVKNAVLNNGICFSDLGIEVTETAVMTNLNNAICALEELKSLGVKIALDDFGTGYSSLSYLQKLPIDILKMDRNFIKNVIYEDTDNYIFKAVVELAHKLGLKVVAEGVETKEQLEFLKNNGCDMAQGFLLGKPLPSVDFFKSLDSANIFYNNVF